MENMKLVEDIVIIGGLFAVQFVYAGNNVVLSYLMSVGFHPASLIIITSFSTFVVLSPFAFVIERVKWPERFRLKLFFQLVLISFGGVTVFQSLLLKGIRLTSPELATAMPNLAPGLIFVIAWAFRLENVTLSCMYSRVKIAGTLMCVIGAVTMSISQSAANPPFGEDTDFSSPFPFSTSAFDTEKVVGCIYLVAAVIVLSSMVVLQATTLSDFPAPLSFCAITSLIGVVLTVAGELIKVDKFAEEWPELNIRSRDLIICSLLAGLISGASVSFNAWAMSKRGPVLVSLFSPVSAVITFIYSATSGDPIKYGSIIGMFLMFTGLYFVLWAKGKEDVVTLCSPTTATEPLLS
ncbi:Nodulin MtN21 /EamA-like transporter family protein [Heracleum sosnowskyi]|uniref:WAT1-related protein n=1 Tax=Heracleum sosnowskyi TaxID=360622 RepID=A0AAD8IB23_9APIA|nr:Nodulin MtN21 /EamA-like transporter family protein [Heracleum sosnowskyi]